MATNKRRSQVLIEAIAVATDSNDRTDETREFEEVVATKLEAIDKRQDELESKFVEVLVRDEVNELSVLLSLGSEFVKLTKLMERIDALVGNAVKQRCDAVEVQRKYERLDSNF